MPRDSDREVLSLESICAVDNGAIGVAFNIELQKLIRDLRDRPDLKKARKINLQISLIPVSDRGQLVRTDVAFAVKVTIPEKATVSYPMATTAEGLEFSPEIPDSPFQRPLKFEKDGDA